MTIPTLPTENLYKFLALLGVTLSIASLILIYTQLDKNTNEIFLLETELTTVEKQQQFANEDLKLLNQKSNDELINLLPSSVVNNSAKFDSVKNDLLRLGRNDAKIISSINVRIQGGNKLAPELESLRMLRAESDSQTKLQKQLDLRTAIVLLKSKQLDRKQEDFKADRLFLVIFLS